VWEILARKTPYDDINAAAITPAVVSGKRPNVNPEWNSTLIDFMQKCWAPLPHDRYIVQDARYVRKTRKRRRNGGETEEKRRRNGGETEEKRRRNGGETEEKQRRNGERKNGKRSSLSTSNGTARGIMQGLFLNYLCYVNRSNQLK
jgi:hypothetical protein